MLDVVGDRRAGRPRRAGASCVATGMAARRTASSGASGSMSSPSRVASRPPCPRSSSGRGSCPPVYERMETGRGEFLAELRPAIPVFLRFGGIDYDNDDDAIEKLDEFVRAAQGVFNGFGGNVLQLTLGDKGAYLYGVFGSPLAHEDDASRAVAAALDLRDLGKTTAARDIQIGIAHGRLRSGTYGHEMRRTFVCLGDAVNLAARLMGAAPRRADLRRRRRPRGRRRGVHLGATAATSPSRARPSPVEVWSLNGSLERASRRKTRFELGLVGRGGGAGAARGAPRGGASPATGGSSASRPRPGWASRASSRSSCASVRRGGQTVAFGECQSYGTKTPYFVWREIWRRLFGLNDDDPGADRSPRSSRQLGRYRPGARAAHAAARATSSGCSIPDTELTRGFDAKLRKTSLEDLLAICLRARAGEAPRRRRARGLPLDRRAVARPPRGPDPGGGVAARAVRPRLPAGREPGGGLGVEAAAGFTELVLDRDGAGRRRGARRARRCSSSGRRRDRGEPTRSSTSSPPGPRGTRSTSRSCSTSSSPRASTPDDPAAIETLRLPDSLHTLVLSRIDARGRGAPANDEGRERRRARVRAPMLPGAYQELGDLERGHRPPRRARARSTSSRSTARPTRRGCSSTSSRRRSRTRACPFALRVVLHGRVGDYIERTEADRPGPRSCPARAPLLAQ